MHHKPKKKILLRPYGVLQHNQGGAKLHNKLKYLFTDFSTDTFINFTTCRYHLLPSYFKSEILQLNEQSDLVWIAPQYISCQTLQLPMVGTIIC